MQVGGFGVSLTGLYFYQKYKSNPAAMNEYVTSCALCKDAYVLFCGGNSSAHIGGQEGEIGSSVTHNGASKGSPYKKSAVASISPGSISSSRNQVSTEGRSFFGDAKATAAGAAGTERDEEVGAEADGEAAGEADGELEGDLELQPFLAATAAAAAQPASAAQR